MYYRSYNQVWESIGSNCVRCIASTRRKMIGVIMTNPNPDNKALAKFYPYDSKETAIKTLENDAWWDGDIVFTK